MARNKEKNQKVELSGPGGHSLGSDRAEVCPEAAPSPVDDLVPRYFETGPILRVEYAVGG